MMKLKCVHAHLHGPLKWFSRRPYRRIGIIGTGTYLVSKLAAKMSAYVRRVLIFMGRFRGGSRGGALCCGTPPPPPPPLS